MKYFAHDRGSGRYHIIDRFTMRTMTIILFVLTFFSIYGLANYYIILRGFQALNPSGVFQTIYLSVSIFLALSFIAGRLLERTDLAVISVPLTWAGSFWIGAFSLLFFIVAAADLFRFINTLFPFIPDWLYNSKFFSGRTVSIAIITVISAVMLWGYTNALWIRTRTLDIRAVDKKATSGSVTIAVASDIHLGTIVGRNRFNKIVSKINSLSPDLILLAGDVVDEDLAPVIRQDLGESLRRLKAPLGVYACTGNHEYIGGAEKACAYLTEHGIRLLRDTTAALPNGLYLAGREDFSSSRFTGKKRRPLSEILSTVPSGHPVILMDHQPNRLSDAPSHNVDLQVSGHTHHGQYWPFNYITDLIFEVSYGYKKKGPTHVYVSSGAGTWGPPIRLAADPEIVKVRFTWGEK